MKRLSIGFNVVVQVLVFAAIVGMLNYLSFRHFKRWDFSRNQKFALAPLTKNLLANLKKPVSAIVFFPNADAIASDVSALLREYEYAADRKLSVEFVDPYRNLSRAKELSEKYKFGSNDNIVILDCEGRTKFVEAMAMAELDSNGAMPGQPAVVRAFKGEEAITSALLEITEEKQNKVYFLSGHGELPPADEDLLGLRTFIERQNIRVDTLSLSSVDAVPQDASALILLGPKGDFSEREIEILNNYWAEKKGRILALVGAMAKTSRLNQWLSTIGATLQDDILVRNATLIVMENGQPAVRQSTSSEAVGVIPSTAKSVLKDIIGFDLELVGLSRSIAVDSEKAQSEKIRAIPLLISRDDYWGETSSSAADLDKAVKDAKDHEGPLNLAVAFEKGGIEDPRVKVETARLIVAGNASFLSNAGLRKCESGIDFAVYSINWLINREQLAGIAPKPKEALRLSLNENQMERLALAVLGLIPCSVAVLGCIAWWRRRS